MIFSLKNPRRIIHEICDGLRHIPRNLKESGCTMMIVVPLVLETMYKRIWAEAEKKGAAGRLLPGVDVRIHRPGPEGVGEVLVKGPSVMLGYYEQPEETARVFTADGYFRTGDLGYTDRDGFLHITGRAKNVIIAKNGRNVYPEEIESLLNLSPYVLESMVYAKPDPHEDGDVVVAAIIVPAVEHIHATHGPGMLTDDDFRVLIQNVVRRVNDMLPGFKRIRDVSIRETEFIKTTTKKIKRYLEKPV